MSPHHSTARKLGAIAVIGALVLAFSSTSLAKSPTETAAPIGMAKSAPRVTPVAPPPVVRPQRVPAVTIENVSSKLHYGSTPGSITAKGTIRLAKPVTQAGVNRYMTKLTERFPYADFRATKSVLARLKGGAPDRIKFAAGGSWNEAEIRREAYRLAGSVKVAAPATTSR